MQIASLRILTWRHTLKEEEEMRQPNTSRVIDNVWNQAEGTRGETELLGAAVGSASSHWKPSAWWEGNDCPCLGQSW